jgi:uncharacterized RmlC-like cupin family protein
LNPTISIAHSAELSGKTHQTSESLRIPAIAEIHGIGSSLWIGMFVVEPLAKTGIHHHGKQDIVVPFLKDRLVCTGPTAGTLGHRGACHFLHVPSLLPHQELNLSTEHPLL